MATATSPIQAQLTQNQFESGFDQSKTHAQQQEAQQDKKAMNDTWNAFLRPDNAQNGSFTRLDNSADSVYSTQPEEKKLNFAEILAKIQQEANIEQEAQEASQFRFEEKSFDSGQEEKADSQFLFEEKVVEEENRGNRLEGTFVFAKSESFKSSVGEDEVVESRELPNIKPEAKKTAKEQFFGSAEKIAETSSKIARVGFKESKDVFKAASDLWFNFIGFREKKKDPNAEKNAKKEAERKARKLHFVGLLKEGIALYYSALKKAMMELEVKLGVNALRSEDRNRFLGRNRNLSFEGNDSIYAIHQTAFEMIEQKKRQQSAQAPKAAARGKPSRGQIFMDKNLSGERSAGNNMMSAVG